MSAAPETKYTDRDVREDSSLTPLVYDYIENYQGEFQFLVDCKLRLNVEGELPTGLIRGALNCMRVDPRVTGLPAPLPPERGTVTHISKGNRKYKKEYCVLKGFHPAHGGVGSDDGFHYCEGLYEINRKPYSTVVKLNDEIIYVAAKSPTALLHRVPEQAEQDSWCVWYPNAHEPGFYMDPNFFTRPLCLTPYVLKNPILLTHIDMVRMQANDATHRPRCERCLN